MELGETDSELQLLRLVRQGDNTAQRTVYKNYVRYLAAVCSRYILNDEDVKDVLQDSFLKIFSSISTF
jgi:RNA polymerase sigma-70 factor